MSEKKDNTKLKKFFEENRTLVFTIPLFFVLIIVVVLVYLIGGSGSDKKAEVTPDQTNNLQQSSTAEPAVSQTPAAVGTEGTTLPQNERNKDSEEISRNPFADPYRVSGIIYDKSGNSLAIIEAENKSFIVETGEEVSGYFKVINIEEKKVVLEVEGKELVLALSSD